MVATATLETRSIQGESLAAVTDRLVNQLLLVEGVRDKAGGSFEVKQNLGTDMNVKVGSLTAFDQAVIAGDLAGQGKYITEHQNPSQVLAVAASDPTNDRIDNVILRVFDDTFDSSGDDFADIEVTTGTPSGSPVPPTVPSGSFVLAEILVQNAVTQIVNGDITDKRHEVVTKGQFIERLIFTSNSSFVKADHTPGLRMIRVRVQSGGGGGGGCETASAGQGGAGAGGGGGGYAEEELLPSALGASETITVGAGGAAGSDQAGAGGAGGSSSLGSLLSATGGAGGAGSSPSATWFMAHAGAGGVGSGGDLNIDGGAGMKGISGGGEFVMQVGMGGYSHMGAPGRHDASDEDSPGPAGDDYGGGGGGAYARGVNGDLKPGGAGAAGIVIVDLYA